MQIELTEAVGMNSFSGGPELHLRVLSDELVDLPRIVLQLDEAQQAIWRRYVDKPTYYYPADTTKESHGFKYDDEWHFPRKQFVRD